MPRAFSSGNRSGSIPVSALTSALFPWSTCPAVARMKFFTAIRLLITREGSHGEPRLESHCNFILYLHAPATPQNAMPNQKALSFKLAMVQMRVDGGQKQANLARAEARMGEA